MELNKKLATIQTKFKSKKSRYNSFGKYYFRSAEDILEAIKPFLLELGVTVTVSETLCQSSSVPIIMSTAKITDGVDIIIATAVVGVDLNQKGMQTPQQFGSASSYGKKYALGNLLLIDDTQDSDASNTHGTTSAKKPKLAKGSDEFNKAKEYIKAGGTVAKIKLKYDVSAAVEKLLTE
tara:strand:- start:108 stop:644 length:537 start_codon:yes stop_codon:yes gene_type:complete